MRSNSPSRRARRTRSATTSTWLAVLALAAGMIVTMLGAMRVGLLTRWMGVLGIITGVLIFLPIGGDDARDRARLLAGTAMGMLYAERWPGGDPPAWSLGRSASMADAGRSTRRARGRRGRGARGGRSRGRGVVGAARRQQRFLLGQAQAQARRAQRRRTAAGVETRAVPRPWARTAYCAPDRWPGADDLAFGRLVCSTFGNKLRESAGNRLRRVFRDSGQQLHKHRRSAPAAGAGQEEDFHGGSDNPASGSGARRIRRGVSRRRPSVGNRRTRGRWGSAHSR